jgi:hypothetical protein
MTAEPVPGAPASAVGRRAVFWRYLALILIAKALLEVFFFVGVARQYGEEDIFVSLALPPREPGQNYWHLISKFREVSDWAAWKGDPCDMYPFRIAALYPNTLFMRAFGASETSLVLWTAITGIGAVLLVALIGRSLVDAPAGLFSASILALIPGHIIYTARVDTDMPQLFFMGLGIVFLVLALQAATTRKQLAFAAASGLALGFLYLSKLPPAFLALGWALLIPFLLAALGDKETLLGPGGRLRQAVAISAVLLGGFALVFAAENCAYYHLSGHWFLHCRIMKGNAVNIGAWRSGKSVTWWFFKFWVPPGGEYDIFAHARMFSESLFPVGLQGSIYSTPIHGWSAVAFLPAFLVLPFLRISRRKLSILLILGFVFYYLYQEFFWLYPTIEGGRLNLTMVHKVHRFIFPCYLGISLCVGLVLGWIFHLGDRSASRWPGRLFQTVSVGLVFAFGLANFASTRYFHALLRGSLADLREVCSDLKTIAPDQARIFIAAGSEPFYRLFEYPRHYELKYFIDGPPEDVCDGWGVVGGSLGVGSSQETFVMQYPVWLRPYYNDQAEPPPGWRTIRKRPSSVDRDLPPVRIVELPARSPEIHP